MRFLLKLKLSWSLPPVLKKMGDQDQSTYTSSRQPQADSTNSRNDLGGRSKRGVAVISPWSFHRERREPSRPALDALL